MGKDEIRHKKTTPAEIIGVVIPVEWDEKAVPFRFAISAYDENEYIIDGTGFDEGNRRLLLGKKVKAVGAIRKTEKNKNIITVDTIFVVPE